MCIIFIALNNDSVILDVKSMCVLHTCTFSIEESRMGAAMRDQGLLERAHQHTSWLYKIFDKLQWTPSRVTHHHGTRILVPIT